MYFGTSISSTLTSVGAGELGLEPFFLCVTDAMTGTLNRRECGWERDGRGVVPFFFRPRLDFNT